MAESGEKLPGWWPSVRYNAAAIPTTSPLVPTEGANCQRFAYAVLASVNRPVLPHRSSELWMDPRLAHPAMDSIEKWDLVLFNRSSDPYGSHVAVTVGEGALLHLCAEVGLPVVWSWNDFAVRERYGVVVGIVRVPHAPRCYA